jgi:hypothetical protein
MGKSKRSSAETQAHNITSRQKTDRGGTAGTVGEDTGGEEGGVASRVMVGQGFAHLSPTALPQGQQCEIYVP